MPKSFVAGSCRLLDTGADQIVLSNAAAQRLGLVVKSIANPGTGASGNYSAGMTTIDNLAVSNFKQSGITAYVVPFPEEFIYDGVLGVPFFAALRTTLDYQQHTVTLQSPDAPFELDPGAMQIPMRVESGKLLVQANAAGVMSWFSVDTGAGNAIMFFTQMSSKTAPRRKRGSKLAITLWH